MADTKVARRYAKALLDLGKEKNIVEEIFKDIVFVGSVVRENRQLGVMFKSPLLKDYKKNAVLTAVFEGKINKVTLEFLRMVANKNREFYINEIVASFVDLYKVHKNIQTAFVTTAVPMDDKTRSEVSEIVRKATGHAVELNEKVDPSIIGGFILRWGDKQLDSSVANQLYSLKKEFTKSF